jgi:polyhydroxyalkanoate synthase
MLQKSFVDSYTQLLGQSVSPIGAIDLPKVEVESQKYDVVMKMGRVRLLRYTPLKKKTLPIPLLIVYAMINRYYILDLEPQKSVIKHYLDEGIDVYIIDWGDPGPEDMYETIEDVIGYIEDAVNYISKNRDANKLNIQGYCMGGTFAAIYASIHPSLVNSLILQAAPIDFSTRAGILNTWASYMDVSKVVDTLGNVPSEFLNFGFLMIDPVRLMFDKYVKFYENIKDKEYVQNFLRMEKWIFDSPDLPGEVYREFITDLFQKNLLAKNEYVVEGKKVDLKNIDMPLLNIVGSEDTLVAPESSLPVSDLVSSKEKETVNFPSGHIGISVSGKAQRELWPKVAKWIANRSEIKKKRKKS